MRPNEFVKHLTFNDIEIDVGLDDYGQTYFIEYTENGKLVTECVGTYISEYEDYIEWRFGIPEKNCPLYNQTKTTEHTCCEVLDKPYCSKCRKSFTDEFYNAWQKRNIEFENWLKEKKNENNIT